MDGLRPTQDKRGYRYGCGASRSSKSGLIAKIVARRTAGVCYLYGAMVWTGWSNGGKGYGFTVDPNGFDPAWAIVIVELPGRVGTICIEANVAKPSFTNKCPHLIDKRIGAWM